MPGIGVSGDSSVSSVASVTSLGQGLLGILMGPDIQVGDPPSYELCKAIYLYHPLGQKMAEAPVSLAQSQERKITINDAPPEVLDAFRKEWAKIGATGHIRNLRALARVYGIASIVLGCKDVDASQPLDMEKIWDQELWFNVLDPLNTAGSLVLSQIPTEADFLKPVIVRTRDQVFHRSRYQVMMNERPVYLAYTQSAFGFVGRSVYQRALFPLKSFIRTMIADDMIAMKLGLLIAKQKPPGAVLDKVMQKIANLKRALLKEAKTHNVLSIDIEEEIETLDMTNVDGAGNYSRNNILKNIATAADMPAHFLENETMVEGFGEGTEDAKNIARYVEGERMLLNPVYAWFDNIVQYRAWNPRFFDYIKTKYPSQYEGREYADAFSEWRAAFAVEWPSLLIEPESEQIKVEQIKFEAIVAFIEALGQQLDPENKMRLLQWAADNLNEEKMLFPHALELDWETLEEFAEEQQTMMEENEQKMIDATAEGAKKGPMMGGGKPGMGGGKPGQPGGNNKESARAGAKLGVQQGQKSAAAKLGG